MDDEQIESDRTKICKQVIFLNSTVNLWSHAWPTYLHRRSELLERNSLKLAGFM